MKPSVTSLLNTCQPQELDSILEKIDIELPDDANSDTIKALAMQKAGVSSKRRTLRKVALIAACITVVAAILVGCYVAEKVEYDNAVKFFDLNDLDTEGMSRDDIKRVYRDITTERFQYNDSYELLKSSQEVTAVEGVDISIMNSANNNSMTFDDEDLWNHISDTGTSYVFDSDVAEYYSADAYYKNAHIEKYIDGKRVWRADFKRPFYINGYDVRGGRVLVWGDEMYDTERCLMHTTVTLVDDADGTILWEKALDSKYAFDEYAEATLSDSGQIAVLTVACGDRFADNNTLVFRELDKTGKVVTEHEQALPQLTYFSVDLLTPLSDGWLAEMFIDTADDENASYQSRLVKFNRKGEIESEWSMTENDDDLYCFQITDVIEHNGRIYLSTHTEKSSYISTEGADTRDFSHYGTLADGFSDEWRDRAREQYSATLYVLEPENGTPEQFYSVGGTLPVSFSATGGDFTVDDDGNLVWHIGRIIRCGYSPYTSSFVFYGITRQYDYTFDSDNNILRQEKTDIFGSFRI